MNLANWNYSRFSQSKKVVEEYYAVQNWLKNRVFDLEVSQNKYSLELCYSATTPMGQINLGRHFVDCYVLLTKGV